MSGVAVKRKRTTQPPSSESIAQANANLHHFTGLRQNRWMQGFTPSAGGSSLSEVVGPDTEDAASSNRQHPPSQDITGEATRQSVRGTESPTNPAQPQRDPSTTASTEAQRSQSRAGEDERAEDETAEVTPNMQSHAQPRVSTFTLGNQRKLSTQAHSPSDLAGLPSPAPSEENGILPSPGLASRAVQSNLFKHASHSSTAPQGPSLATHRPTNPSRLSGSNFAVTTSPNALMTNRTQSRAANLPSNRSMPNHLFDPAGMTQAVTLQPQQVLFNQSHPGNVYHKDALLQRLNAYRQYLVNLNACGFAELNRVYNLQNAVHLGDWFCVHLSQLVSIQTVSRAGLPDVVRELPDSCLQGVRAILQPGLSIGPAAELWFSTFPEPIHSAMSSAMRTLYEKVMAPITRFLRHSQDTLMAWIGEHVRLEALPLCRDIAESLLLPSPVLQTAVFKTIVFKLLCNQNLQGDRCVAVLGELHKLDQNAFNAIGWPRNEMERRQAGRGFDSVLSEWRAHVSRTPVFPSMSPEDAQKARYMYGQSFQMPQAAVQAFSVPYAAVTALPLSHQIRGTAQPPSLTTHASPTRIQAAPSAVLQQTVPTLPSPQSLHQVQQAYDPRQPPTSQTSAQYHVASTRLVPGARDSVSDQQALLYPREEEPPRAQPRSPDSFRSGLHQSHLRSPILSHAEPFGDTPLYRCIVGFALMPIPFGHVPIQEATFTVDATAFERLPQEDRPSLPGERPRMRLRESSQQYRLRVCVTPPEGLATEHDWIVADSVWPDDVYIMFNGRHLEERRKLHHGRYLPIDLTPMIRQGENKLTLVINRVSTDPRPLNFAYGVEIVGVMSEQSINGAIDTVSAEDSSTAIRELLSSRSADAEDDDVVLTSTNLTIKLFDPVSSASIFDVPVRGKACAHRDCFDLKTFLSLRPRQSPGSPTAVDCWRCPWCRGDVRPQTLIIDGYLLKVRTELEAMGMLATRAIVVEADGSWKPKAEERTGIRSLSLEREEAAAAASAMAAGDAGRTGIRVGKRTMVTQVIDLDSD